MMNFAERVFFSSKFVLFIAQKYNSSTRDLLFFEGQNIERRRLGYVTKKRARSEIETNPKNRTQKNVAEILLGALVFFG